MKSKGFWLPVIVSLILTPVFLLLAVGSGGAGHGDYVLARILFPYTLLAAILTGNISVPLVCLAILQFPLYGMLAGYAVANRRARAWLLVIFLAHVIVAAACFTLAAESFS